MFDPAFGKPRARLSAGAFSKAAALVAVLGFPLNVWTISAQAAVHLAPADGANGDEFGRSATELEDLNADGRWEFLVGAPGDQTAGLDAGAVFMWLGGHSLTVAPDHTWAGQSPERFGWSVARIGDVDGDGAPDWAVGAPGSNSAGLASGRVYVFFGAATPPAAADLVIDGENAGDEFGTAVCAAGDFDGDGRDDFIVGAPYSDRRAQNAGAAYVIYGAPGGPSADLADATVLTGQIAEDHFGWSVSDAGNFLGGNEDCVAVGAPLSNLYGGLDAGAVYVYEGTLGGAAPDTSIDFAAGISASAKAGSHFGQAVRACGQWSGDGYADLAVGAPACNENAAQAGRVEIFFGGTSPAATAARTVNGQTAGDALGFALARAYDVSGTSLDDLLIGAPGRDAVGAEAGAAYIYEGGDPSFSTAASLVPVPLTPLLAGTAAGDGYGTAVASAGDFDGDGLWDYAVGAVSGNNLSGSTCGYCYVVDSTDLVVPNLLDRWQARWDGPDRIRLEFQVDGAAAGTDVMVLVRLTGSGEAALARQVWQGPAVADDGLQAAPGILTYGPQGLAFLDVLPASWAASPEPVSYELTVRTAQWAGTLSDLQGPDLAARPQPAAGGAGLELKPAWPNPANPQVTVAYRAPAGAPVRARVMDLRGRVVCDLQLSAGTGEWQDAVWDGRDRSGAQAPSGVYFVQVSAAGLLRSQRLVLAR